MGVGRNGRNGASRSHLSYKRHVCPARTRDFEAALARLGELSQPLDGVCPVDVKDAGGGLIRVTPTEVGIEEYEPPITDQSIRNIRARLFGVPATVEREGAWRIRVQVPKLGPDVLTRMNW